MILRFDTPDHAHQISINTTAKTWTHHEHRRRNHYITVSPEDMAQIVRAIDFDGYTFGDLFPINK